MTKTVLYWRGAIDATVDLETNLEAKNALNKLLAGENVDLEKLRGHQIYSARINIRDRLLLTTTVIDGEQYVVVLEIICNHDYENSSFLKKPSVLKQFMEINGSHFSEIVEVAKAFSPENTPLIRRRGEEDARLNFKPVDYDQQKFIQFDAGQEEAITTTLPVMINGPAGSGKTIVAISIIDNALKNSKEEGITILYLAKSQFLVSKVKDSFFDSPREIKSNQSIRFLTYFDLLAELDKTLSLEDCVDTVFFETWLHKYIQHYKRSVGLSESITESFLSRPDLIHQGFCVLAGYSEDDYLALGKKNSVFDEPFQKKWLLAAYKAYLQHLMDEKKMDVSFHQLPKREAPYDIVVLDEAQDCSPPQLLQVYRLAKKGQLVFCVDTHQRLRHHKSIRPYLQYICGTDTLATVSLGRSHRCLDDIIKVTNGVIQLKMEITQGLADRQEIAQIPLLNDPQYSSGEVVFCDTKDQVMGQIACYMDSPDFAIIARPESIEEVRQKFQGVAVICTAEEIKGLEYGYALVYDMLSHPTFGEINRKLSRGLSNKSHNHRAKNQDEDADKYALAFNELITALTRARNHLVIFQSNDNAFSLHNIISHIKSIVNSLKPSVELAEVVSSPVAPVKLEPINPAADADLTAEAWRAQYYLHEKLGNHAVAQRILTTHLQGDMGEKKAASGALTDKANISPIIESKPVESKPATATKSTPPLKAPAAETRPQPSKSRQAVKKGSRAQKGRNAKTVSVPKPLSNEEAVSTLYNTKNLLIREPLTALLSNKQYNPRTLLFKTDNHKPTGCLFNEIVSVPQYATWINKAPLKTLLASITVDELFVPFREGVIPPICFLIDGMSTKIQRDFLSGLLEKPGFAQAITGEKLSMKTSEGLTSLYFLADYTHHPHHELLRQMWRKNKFIFTGITKEVFYQQHEKRLRIKSISKVLMNEPIRKPVDMDAFHAFVGRKKSAFDYLSLSENTIPVLQDIFAQNPALIDGLPLPMLIGTSFCFSPLVHLIINPMGQELLKMLWEARPALRTALTEKVLGKPQTSELMKYDMALIKSCKANDIPSGQWGEMRSHVFGHHKFIFETLKVYLYHESITFLYLLAAHEEQSGLLNYLLDKDNQFAHLLTAELLCKPIEFLVIGIRKETTALFHLCQGVNGAAVLKKLFSNNESLIKELALTAHVHYDSVTFLYLLAAHEEQNGLLNYLLDKDIQLAYQITAKSLCAVKRHRIAGIENETTTLFHLCKGDNGIAVLKKLLRENTRLITELKLKHLRPLLQFDRLEQDEDGVYHFIHSIPSTNLAKALVADEELLALFCKNPLIADYLRVYELSVEDPQESSIVVPGVSFFSHVPAERTEEESKELSETEKVSETWIPE